MKKNFFFFLMLLCSVIGVGARAIAADATPADRPKAELLTNVKPGDCAGCHKDTKVLGKKHVDTREMVAKDCQRCHKPDDDPLEGTVPLGHIHALNGLQCAKCHDGGKPQPVTVSKCVTCHKDTKELAQKTADVKPTNPHESRHYGTEADCNLCHHQHVKSENHCASCHTFDFKVP
jgi:hypothetical protein